MALSLSRKKGQSIVIGGTVKITVQETNAGRCRLAIEAPASVPIKRSELLDLDVSPCKVCGENVNCGPGGPPVCAVCVSTLGG